ncbi:hypothetical protein [Shewanella decolorationis]|uniref:hypothetical protein n=1 Tax=Shewanella decolorationis TaxID=256839 RepID=UPI0003FBCB03|nr:hypothetical protein [Shewanella decolorationis]GLR34182.1 hypothetical protein GCM10007922_37410 [Shewanella decolorationis]
MSTVIGLVFCILIITLLVFLPLPSFLSYFGYENSVTLVNADNINDPYISYIIGDLVKSGTLISLKDVWSFQTGFYQTIITILVAINGLIAAISVIYIKSTSEEKAEEITKKYMSGDLFNHSLNQKVEAQAALQLRVVQSDYSATAETFEKSAQMVDGALERLAFLEAENQTLRQQLKVIAERVAKLDATEAEGKDYRLVKKGMRDGVRKKIG